MTAPSQPFTLSDHVEISSGTVTAATITDASGTRDSLTHLGSKRYFVDVVENDGSRVCMWDGNTHHEAVQAATFLALDFGPVRDLTEDAA